jgi:uncharacterized membrane protein
LGAHNVVYVTTSTTDRTMTLPAASSATVGKYLIIKADNASGDVLLAPNGSDTLNGVNGTTGITNQYESMEVTLVSSTEWQVIKTVTGIDGANLAAGSVAAAALAGFTIAELNTLVSDANLVVDPGSNGLVNRTAATTASAITSTTVGQTLRVTGSNAFAFGALDLADTDAVTGILPGANGGTGNGFFAVSGPATSLKTFTFPNASSTVLTSNAAVTIAQGGTGTGSTLTGVLLGSGSAFTAVTSTTVGQVLRVTGSNTFAFGALDLADTDAVTGVLPVGNLPSNLALLDATNTWSDGVKQTFNPNATNAGVNVGSHAGDPSSPANGDLWYDSSANELTARINGANVALGAGGGGGTPGGSDTQVQFNNSSSFGGSANLTWVSPALTIGVEASASGTLNLANGNATGDTVTIQNISTTAGDWNFNLPATAGSSGQVLTSAAGGSSPMTWTTLAASATTDTTNASNISSGTLSEARFPDASDTVRGDVELATAAETTTGTDTGRAVTPDGLAGSDFGKRYITVECVADATALTTGDGKCYFPIHPDLNGWLVVDASAHVGAAVSSSGAVDVDIDVCGAVATGIRCSGTNRDLLSTNITIDANEDGTETATAETINTSNDDLATGEWLRFNIDGAGTGTQGLYVTVVLQKP